MTERHTVDCVTYRLSTRSYDDYVQVDGPGILRGCCILPAGVRLDSLDLRDQIRAAVAAYRQRRAEAARMVQQRVKDGTAGLGSGE